MSLLSRGKNDKRGADGGDKDVPAIDRSVFKLAATGNAEGVRALAEADGFDVNAMDETGMTALCWASRNGHVEVVRFLVDRGADVERPSCGGMRPLHHAANYVQLEVMKELLDRGADLRTADDAGNTPLHWFAPPALRDPRRSLTRRTISAARRAAARGVLNTAQMLIEAGADVNAVNKHGATPLHASTNNGHVRWAAPWRCVPSSALTRARAPVRQVSCMQKLLSAGANLQAQDDDRSTPLVRCLGSPCQ